jgi:hypothetical protein
MSLFELALRFIRTIHRSIALLLFPAKERSENLADAQIQRPRASRDPGASDWPPAPVAHHLFLLFYQVEIRHRQLLQRQSRTRSGGDARLDIVLLWQLYGCRHRKPGAPVHPGLPTKGGFRVHHLIGSEH